MSNLVPQQRPDKNGHLVTRHVRVDETPAAGKKGIPAPSVTLPSTAAVQSRLGKSVNSACKSLSKQTDDLPAVPVLLSRLDGYSPELLNGYDKAIKEKGEWFENVLVSSLNNSLDERTSGYVMFIGQQKKLGDALWSDRQGGTYSYGDALQLYRGLESLAGEFGFSLPENILDADDEASGKVAALTHVTSSVYALDGEFGIYRENEDQPNEAYSLSNGALIELVLEYPEQAERIANLVYERESDDGELIRQIIESDSPSLSDGTL